MTTNKPRTIDNLGPNISEQYALGQKLYDPSIIKDSKVVAAHAEITANSPEVSSIDKIFGLNEINPPWAHFAPPEGFQTHKRPLYTFQIIPSLGSMESQKEKLATLPEDEKTAILANMIDKLCQTDIDLAYVNSKRYQYNKG